jgi:putative addiction module CopG family antidote
MLTRTHQSACLKRQRIAGFVNLTTNRYNGVQSYKPTKSGNLAMRSTQQFSVTLPDEMAKMVKAKVSSGEYASESEVIRDGLRALRARDKAIENWLRQEVLPAIDAIKTDPSRGKSIADVRASLAAEHKQATKDR